MIPKPFKWFVEKLLGLPLRSEVCEVRSPEVLLYQMLFFIIFDNNDYFLGTYHMWVKNIGRGLLPRSFNSGLDREMVEKQLQYLGLVKGHSRVGQPWGCPWPKESPPLPRRLTLTGGATSRGLKGSRG